MPIYSMSCYDAEDWLVANGIPKPHCPTAPKYPQFQCLQVGYDDGKDGKESRAKYLNGACFQFELDDDKFLQDKPTVKFASKDKKSTLLMIDPDAPDRVAADKTGEMGPYLHWLVTDCDETAEKGVEALPYMGPAPPKGKHRYIFVEFEELQEPKLVKMERARFDLRGFVSANKGRLVPVAINFYYCAANKADAELEFGPRIKPDGTGSPSGLDHPPY
jgi:phosphatidylethanolamine-binding protein (PEBP) family uncharacterized protein